MTKKKIISRFMAALMAAFILCFSIVSVSAAENDKYLFPDSQHNTSEPYRFSVYFSGTWSFDLFPYYDAFFSSVNYSSDDYFYLFVRPTADNYVRAFVVPKSLDTSPPFYFPMSWGDISRAYVCDYPESYTISDDFVVVRSDVVNYGFDIYYGYSGYMLNLWFDTGNNVQQRNCYFLTNWFSPYSLGCNFEYDSSVITLGINVQEFYNWYNSTNDKYKNQLFGVNEGTNFKIIDSNLMYLLDYFNSYGSTFDSFYNHFSELSPCFKNSDFVGPPAKDDFINLFTVLKQHYNIYLKYKSMFIKDVTPNVSEDDTTLITDIDVDTVDISLLREILRTLILTYNSVNDVDYDLSSYVFNMYLKIDSLVDNIDSNFTLLRNDLNSNFVNLSNDIGVAVAANLSPSINALAVPLTDIDANVQANLQAVNNIDASLDEVNNSVNNLDVSLHEINNTLNDGSGSGGCSGSRPCAPDLPEAEFDDLYEQSGDFFKFFRDLLDSSGWIPASLFTAACLVAIFMRVWGR